MIAKKTVSWKQISVRSNTEQQREINKKLGQTVNSSSTYADGSDDHSIVMNETEVWLVPWRPITLEAKLEVNKNERTTRNEDRFLFSSSVDSVSYLSLFRYSFSLPVEFVNRKRRTARMTAHDNVERIALVTGANKGIGFEVARQLGQKNIHVLLGSRDIARGQKAVDQLTAERLRVSLIQIDVTNRSLIDAAVQEITTKYARLDILVNNSGVFQQELRPSELTVEHFRHTFEVNFFGAISVTKAFLPLLRQSTSARIVNVSSGLGTFGLNQVLIQPYSHCTYSTSKTALNMYTFQLARDLKETKIKVNACTPGLTATELTNYDGHPVEVGARPIVLLATIPDDGPNGTFYGEDCQENPWWYLSDYFVSKQIREFFAIITILTERVLW